MQSYVLQAFEIVATTGVERRHSNRSSPAGLEHTKRAIHRMTLFCYLFEARDVAERPGGTFACDDRSGAETFEPFEPGRART